MRAACFAALLAGGLTAALPAAAQEDATAVPEDTAAAAVSVMDGVYTMEQADRGEAAFDEECSLCHEAADFQDAVFEDRWSGRPASVLFSFMQDSLAHGEVADLDGEGYAAILAWMFRLNGFPAGGSELPAERAALAAVLMAEPTGEPARVLATAGAAPPVASPSVSLASGVYTAEQAGRGRTVFTQICAACHGPSEFQGADFEGSWAGRSLGSLFAFISENMPEDAPGSLASQEYADVLAYLLELNGAPPGARPLPAGADALAVIRFDPSAPAGGGGGADAVGPPLHRR